MSKFDKFLNIRLSTPSGIMSIADITGTILNEEDAPENLDLKEYVKTLYPNVTFVYHSTYTYNKKGQQKTWGVFLIEKSGKIYRTYTIFFSGRQDVQKQIE